MSLKIATKQTLEQWLLKEIYINIKDLYKS